MEQPFDISKYLGKWYELAHSHTWFQDNTDYNTQAEYSLLDNGNIEVKNTTMNNGDSYMSLGEAKYINDLSFRVDFGDQPPIDDITLPNYNIQKIWLDWNCKTQQYEYITAVVTNYDATYFSVISRYPNPSLSHYNQVMKFITEYFDSEQIIQTPHFI